MDKNTASLIETISSYAFVAFIFFLVVWSEK